LRSLSLKKRAALVITSGPTTAHIRPAVEMLKSMGFKKVLVATTQEEIDKHFKQHDIDLVIYKAPEGAFVVPRFLAGSLFLPDIPINEMEKRIKGWLESEKGMV
jgi:hypothetical protein